MNSCIETTNQMELLIFLEPYLIRKAIPSSSLDPIQVTSVFNSKPQWTKKKFDFHDGKKKNHHPIDLALSSKKTQTYWYCYFLLFDFQVFNISFLNILIARIEAVLDFSGHLSLSLEGRHLERNFVLLL